jgi:hypothetical protein
VGSFQVLVTGKHVRPFHGVERHFPYELHGKNPTDHFIPNHIDVRELKKWARKKGTFPNRFASEENT